MSILAKSKGEVTYKDLTGFHKWFLIVLISMGSSIIYTPMYLKGVFYDSLMTALGCTNADLGAMVSFYGIVALICYLPSGIIADKFRMRTLAWVGFIGTAVLTFLYAMLPSVQMCYVLFGGMGLYLHPDLVGHPFLQGYSSELAKRMSILPASVFSLTLDLRRYRPCRLALSTLPSLLLSPTPSSLCSRSSSSLVF